MVENSKTYTVTDIHAQPLSKEDQHALSLATNILGGNLVGIHKTSDEKEIVADTVQGNSNQDHPLDLLRSTNREKDISENPCHHPNQNHPLDAKLPEKEGNQEHEEDF